MKCFCLLQPENEDLLSERVILILEMCKNRKATVVFSELFIFRKCSSTVTLLLLHYTCYHGAESPDKYLHVSIFDPTKIQLGSKPTTKCTGVFIAAFQLHVMCLYHSPYFGSNPNPKGQFTVSTCTTD